ncbi:MAG: HNH endonuclease [Rhodobacter sp.]|nr:HNH endonuclease [Rhodobacter sp.]
MSDRGRADRPSRKWYNSKAWKLRRKQQLQREPLCRLCPTWSRRAATIADHVIPHREDRALFFFGELQSLCKSCHDGKKQRLDRRRTKGG